MADETSSETPSPPFIYEGVALVPEEKSTLSDVVDTVKDAAHRIGDTIEAGKRPGMPLSILANVTREAPLGALLAAFLLGVAVARRR